MKKQKTKQTNFWMITTLILILLIVIFIVADHFRIQKQESKTYTIPNIGTVSIDDLNFVAEKLDTTKLQVCNLETKICKQITKLK